ncbi:hypothetical protein CRYUN_Cryun22dG0098800 [Craigia yunnanensis]
MGIDTIEASSHPSQPPSNFSSSNQLRHFYVAVDKLHFKMETLTDLLGVADRRTCLPIVVCCNSRDELDAVCSAVSIIPYISLSSLYSDQADAERALILEKFREATMNWNQQVTVQTGDDHEIEKEEQKSRMIVVTDACLPLLASGESPISARVLINFELPTKKETYMRRLTSCLAADGIVINMVVGGEVVTLKSLGEISGLIIAEMPINVVEEVKQLCAIALPMIMTGVFIYGKSAISMFLMGKLGKEALAGGSLSIGIANITGYSVVSGLAMGMEAISSQACGAEQWLLMGQTLLCTIAILTIACLPISVLWLNIEPILLFCGQDPVISSVASSYLAFSLPNLLFQSLINPLRIFT